MSAINSNSTNKRESHPLTHSPTRVAPYKLPPSPTKATLRSAFQLARASKPVVLFLDEIDSLVVDRGTGDSEECKQGGSVEARVLSTLLNEMDGVASTGLDGVTIVAATNRPPTALDAALMRPGRLEVSKKCASARGCWSL